jgi:hypothetical protein
MRKVTIEAIRANPELLRTLEARARRARADALYGLFSRLLSKFTPRSVSREWGLHWG